MTPTVSVPTTPLPLPAISTHLITAEEFFLKYEDRHAELIKGVVKELPMPDYIHGRICTRASRFLDEFAEANDLGRVMSNDSFVKIRRNPDTVLGADVCFISFERLPKGEIPAGLIDAVPELVIEVRSPSNSWTDMLTKAVDYFSAGVKVVVVIDHPTRSASVYRPEARSDIFDAEEELVLADILPGFAVKVGRFFE